MVALYFIPLAVSNCVFLIGHLFGKDVNIQNSNNVFDDKGVFTNHNSFLRLSEALTLYLCILSPIIFVLFWAESPLTVLSQCAQKLSRITLNVLPWL